MKNSCLETALNELEAAGVRGIEQAHGAKHLQVRWRVNGRTLRLYTIPGSASDVRAPRNVRADIRRLLREDGVFTTPKPKPLPTLNRVALLEQRVAMLERQIEQLQQAIFP